MARRHGNSPCASSSCRCLSRSRTWPCARRSERAWPP